MTSKSKIIFFDFAGVITVPSSSPTQYPLVEGIAAAIKTLSQNYSLIIMSSSSNRHITDFLTHHELLSYFESIQGYEVGVNKAQKMKRTLESNEIDPSKSLLITDTTSDIESAASINIKTIAATWGFQEKNRLAEENPTAIVDNPTELTEKADSLLKDTV